MRKENLRLLFAISVMFMTGGCNLVRPINIGEFNVGENVDLDSMDDLLTPIPTQETTITPTVTLTPAPSGDKVSVITPTPELTPIVTPPVTQNPVQVVVDYGYPFDDQALIEYFYGESRETLIQDGYLDLHDDWQELYQRDDFSGFDCEKDGLYMKFVYGNDINRSSFIFEEKNEWAGARYKDALVYKWMMNEFPNKMLQAFPEKDLENCSMAEAIAACNPIAKACGYTNAQVKAYAMESEVLNTLAYRVAPEYSDGLWLNGAPDVDYDYYEQKALADEYLKQAEEAEAAGNEELAQELKNKYLLVIVGFGEPKIQWTEEMNAYLVVYQTILNGRVLDSIKFQLYCIYVPHYGRVVYAEGSQSLLVTETLEEKELISVEKAVEEVVRIMNFESAEYLILDGVSLVYSVRGANMGKEEKIVDPCWRIDYTMTDAAYETFYDIGKREWEDGTFLISAIDGQQVSYSAPMFGR